MFDFLSGGGQNPLSSSQTMGLMGMNLLNQGMGYGSNQNDIGSLLLSMALRNGLNNGNKNNGINLQNPGINAQQGQAPSTPDINSPPAIPSQSMTGSDLISQLKETAAQTFPNNPVMQRVAMTQAFLESGLQNGNMSKLAQDNNFFGIKSPGNSGSVNMPTNEYSNGSMNSTNASFGTNKTPLDSFMQYKNLMQRPRYSSVFAANSPQDAFVALQQSGYATDPRYAQKLNQVYQQYIAPLY